MITAKCHFFLYMAAAFILILTSILLAFTILDNLFYRFSQSTHASIEVTVRFSARKLIIHFIAIIRTVVIALFIKRGLSHMIITVLVIDHVTLTKYNLLTWIYCFW